MLKFWKKKGADEAAAAAHSEEKSLEPVTPKRTWRERLARSVFNRDIRDLFARHPQLDDALLDELETTLIGADVGVMASTQLIEGLRALMDKREFADAAALLAALRGELIGLLTPVAQPLRIDGAHK